MSDTQSMNAPHDSGRVVVGVDASPGSRSALRWAIRQAQSRDAPLHAVFVWQFHTGRRDADLDAMFPTQLGGGRGDSAGLPTPEESHELTGTPGTEDGAPGRWDADEQAANDGLDAAIGEALGAENAEAMRRTGKVTQAAAEGHPKDVLLAAVTDSDLLVIGSGAHRELSGGHLGSTTKHLVAHSPCPVVVVPDPASHSK